MSKGHAVLVLAAGGSVRLGQPKQLLTRDAESLIHRAVRLGQDISPKRLLLVVGAGSESVLAQLAPDSCEIFHNPDWREGLGSSLRTVAPALRSHEGPVLVIACDQPNLEARHLNALLDGAQRSPAGIAASRYDGVVGIPAVVPGAWFSEEHFAGDRGFAKRLRAEPQGWIFELDAPELSLDIDTPQDLSTAQARGVLDATQAISPVRGPIRVGSSPESMP